MKSSKNIYDILNNTDFDLEDYKIEELSEIEKKKIKDNFSKNKKNKFKFKKIGLIAAALLLTIGILSQTDFGRIVYARTESKISEISYSIGKALYIERDIAPYSNIINKTVESNGVEIKLTDIIIDKDELLFSTIVIADIPSDSIGFDYDIFIDGKKIKEYGASGSSGKIDNSENVFAVSYEVEAKNINIEENIDIKIVLRNFNYMVEESNSKPILKYIKGKWEFEFSANGKELMSDSYSLALDYTFDIDKQEYRLDEFRYNPVSQKIYGTIQSEYENFYAVELRGYDDLGNDVTFGLYRDDNGKMVFKYYNIYGDLSEEASFITLIPYASEPAEEGVRNTNYFEPVGEEFTIYLGNNK